MGLTKIDDRGLKTPIDLLDNEKIRLGTGNDFEISYNGTNTVLAHTANSGAVLIQAAPAESAIRCNASGSVDLYYDNNKKLETTTNGVTVTGNLNFGDNGYAYFGAGNDMGLYSDGSGGFIKSDDLTIGSFTGGEKYIDATLNGAVELYHNNVKKLNTFDSGVVISGDIQAYDNSELQLGDSSDLKIYHDGSNSYLTNDTGVLNIQGGGGNIQLQAVDGESGLIVKPDAAVELYYNGSKKFHTYSEGCSVFGNLNLDDSTGASVGRLRLGDSSDFQIYHDGSNSYLDDTGTGIIYAKGTSSTVFGVEHTGNNNVYLNFKHTGHHQNYIGYEDDHFTVYTKNSGANTHSMRINVDASGLAFHGDTAAANRLNDYEEGTWSPAWGADGTAFSITWTQQIGYYIKIGKLVHCSATLTWTAKSGNNYNNTSALTLSLPFNQGNSVRTGVGHMGYNNALDFNGDSRGVHLGSSGSWCYFDRPSTGSGKHSGYVLTQNLSSSGHIRIAFTYQIG